MIIKGDKESIKKYLIKHKQDINVIDCKFGEISKSGLLSNKILEKETVVNVIDKKFGDLHSAFSLEIFKMFGV